MAPVPVYSSSPITAAKAQGATANAADKTKTSAAAAPAPAAAAPTSQAAQNRYTPAQPGAVPSLPVETGTAAPQYSNYAPTPTQPPQPGAVPEPQSSHHLPPPPKAGETLKPEHMRAPPEPPEGGMPPQISYPAPAAPGHMSRGTAAAIPQPQPQLYGGEQMADPSHPPGYTQDVNASEFNSYQRAAHNAYVSENNSGFGDAGGDGGIWDQAKKWATAAGDSLAAAEHEVWKKINKE